MPVPTISPGGSASLTFDSGSIENYNGWLTYPDCQTVMWSVNPGSWELPLGGGGGGSSSNPNGWAVSGASPAGFTLSVPADAAPGDYYVAITASSQNALPCGGPVLPAGILSSRFSGSTDFEVVAGSGGSGSGGGTGGSGGGGASGVVASGVTASGMGVGGSGGSGSGGGCGCTCYLNLDISTTNCVKIPYLGWAPTMLGTPCPPATVCPDPPEGSATIYRAIGTATGFTEIASGVNAFFYYDDWPGLPLNTPIYYYVVTPCNTSNVAACVLSCMAPPLWAGHCEGGQATLSWPAAPNAVSYILERNGSAVYQGTNTSYVDTGLTIGTQYSYVLIAVFAGSVESVPSPALAVTPCGQYALPGTANCGCSYWLPPSGFTTIWARPSGCGC